MSPALLLHRLKGFDFSSRAISARPSCDPDYRDMKQCACPNMLLSDRGAGICPKLGLDRKSPAEAQTGAPDAERLPFIRRAQMLPLLRECQRVCAFASLRTFSINSEKIRQARSITVAPRRVFSEAKARSKRPTGRGDSLALTVFGETPCVESGSSARPHGAFAGVTAHGVLG